ncbi:MAG TPA: ABC transporter substrate-binding protein [Candidatus Lustribacter sp.]|nr:ABC transporter substrate-binding protein [Candidatus Lustribacter sp.]
MTLARSRALALLAGGLAAASAQPSSAQTGAPVHIGTSLSDPFLEPYYGVEEGLFARAGIAANVEASPNGATIMAAVLGNAMDIGNTDLTQLANAYNRGVDIGVVAAGALYDSSRPTISLVVPKNSPLHTAKDFEGQTIAIPNLKSTGGIAISEWLIRGGADVSKVKFYEMLFPEMGPAMASGRIAAALNGEPFLTDSKNDIRRIVNPYDYVAKSFYTGVWYAKRSWLNANVATAKAFVAAMYATARWANTHQADSAVIAARLTKVDVDKVRTFVRNTFATSLETRYAQPLLDLAFKYKLIEKPTSAADLFWSPPA